MSKTLTTEIPEELYEALIGIVERQESSLEYVVNDAFEIYILAEDYIEDQAVKVDGKRWARMLKEGRWS